MVVPATLHLVVGLPGAGKTTRARELERSHGALRLTPDEWMIPLLGEPEAGDRRDHLEGLLIATALRVLELGTDVVLDFGFWGVQERHALRSLGAAAGARVRVVYLPVDEATQRRRVAGRSRADPATTFPMTEDDLARWRLLFDEPTADELTGGPLPDRADDGSTWRDWASRRWPR